MASKKKGGSAVAEKAPRLKKDGTEWAPPIKRSPAEILAEAVQKRARVVEEAAVRVAACDSTIGKYIGLVSPREAIAAGLTLAQIEQAHAALRERAEKELEALREEQATDPDVPAFLSVE
jgi:hypothetical protein